jgi:hypothetical protein
MSTLPSGLYRVKHYLIRCYGCGVEEEFTRTARDPDMPPGWRKATHSWAMKYGMRDRHEYFCNTCYGLGNHQKWLDSFDRRG